MALLRRALARLLRLRPRRKRALKPQPADDASIYPMF